MVTVAVSGGFDPLHVGHLSLFEAAKKLGDKLIVIVNNDAWLLNKKGFVFMKQKDRLKMIKALSMVDEAILTKHQKKSKDKSVCKELVLIKPDVFANGGDRKANNIPEYEFCGKLGIKMVFGVGGKKIRSSSKMVR